MNGRPDTQDRNAVDAPRSLEVIFVRVASRFEVLELRNLYRALNGRTVDVDDVDQLLALEQDFNIDPATTTRLAEKYNSAIAEYLSTGQALEDLESGRAEYAKKRLKVGSLRRAIEKIGGFRPSELAAAQMIADELRGLRPPRGDDAIHMRDRLGLRANTFEAALEIYKASVALHRTDRSSRTWNLGYRRRAQQRDMSWVMPAALIRRIPLVANNHFRGAIGGGEFKDVQGKFYCSEPLRSGAVGILGYVLGIASHPKRFAQYNQIDEEGRVLASLNRCYEAAYAAAPGAEPGGAGCRTVGEHLMQLARTEMYGENDDVKGYFARGLAPDMSIPSWALELIEKLVDTPEGDQEWVTLDDPRRPTRFAEFTLRFTVADWCLERMGVEGEDGDRVFLDPTVYRSLSPVGRAMYLVTQGSVGRPARDGSGHEIQFQAEDRWVARFGMLDCSHEKRKELILAGFNELYHADTRVLRYLPPWLDGTNADGYTFAIIVEGRSEPTSEVRERIRRVDFMLELLAYEEDDDVFWPGLPQAKPPPRST